MKERKPQWYDTNALAKLIASGEMKRHEQRGGCPENIEALDMMVKLNSGWPEISMEAWVEDWPNIGLVVCGLRWRHVILIPYLYELLTPWLTQADDLTLNNGTHLFEAHFGN